jgi:hypothetical protein
MPVSRLFGHFKYPFHSLFPVTGKKQELFITVEGILPGFLGVNSLVLIPPRVPKSMPASGALMTMLWE